MGGSPRDAVCAETEHASVRLLAGPLLTIRSNRNSAALSRGFRSVADTGLSAALPLSLSARAKRNTDRRHHEARHDWSFVIAAVLRRPRLERQAELSEALEV